MRKGVIVSITYPPLIKNGFSMLFLVLFSCFTSSCPQNFNSSLNDTLSNYEKNLIYEEEKYNEFSHYFESINRDSLNNEDLNTHEYFTIPDDDLQEEKYLAKTFLEGNYRKVFDNDERKYNKSWWKNTIIEIVSYVSSISNCSAKKFFCGTNYKADEFRIQRVCDCDSSCGVYGECCIDKAITMSKQEKIGIENRMYCEILSLNDYNTYSRGIYMVGDCLPEMEGTIEEELCHRKVEYKSYSVILDVPMLSLDTNITYINYYCAVCNNDSNSFLHLDYSLSCFPEYLPGDNDNLTLEEFLLEAKYIPRKLTYERKIPANNKKETEFKEGNSTVTSVDKTMKSTHSVGFLPTYLNSPPVQTCKLKITQYEDVNGYASLYGSRICTPSVERCSEKNNKKRESCTRQVTDCDSSWPVLADFEKCSLYSLKVYDESKNVLYKNPHCAKCNYASLRKDQFSCKDLKIHTYFVSAYDPRVFTVLFQIPNQSPRKCPKRDEIWNPFDDRCSKIICGTGRVLRKGKCVKNRYEHYENNLNQSSSLLNNCPTIAVTNFTLYENNSVFHYNSNKFFEIGEYELYNESIILICSENQLYFKKNFLFSYYTTVIVLSISLVCLVFHISLYFCYSRLRTWHGRNLLSLCFSLFIAQFLFLTGITATEHFGFCVFMAVCIHYFWLASFFWMNILSIDVWRTFKTKFSQKSNSKKIFLVYGLYSWGSPFVIVITSLSLDLISQNSKYKPYYAGFEEAELCWINNRIGHFCFFLLPVAIIITANVIIFTITSYKIYSQSKETRFANVKSQSLKVGEQNLSEEEKTLRKQEKAYKNCKIRFVSYLKLGVLQGLSWVIGFFATYSDLPICWYIFTVLNGLQGAAIVLSFDVKKWIFDSIWKKLSNIFMRLKFSKSTQETTCKNGQVKEENNKNKCKNEGKDSFCRKKNNKALFNSSQMLKRSKVSSNETDPSDASVVSSKNNDSNSEYSTTSNLTESTYL